MAFRKAFRNGLVTVLAAAWPELAGGGIYRYKSLGLTTLGKKIAAGQLPFAAYEVEMGASDEWGLANHVDDGTVTAFYVREDPNDADGLTDRLDALYTYLITHPLPVGQMIGTPELKDEVDDPLMRYFLGTAQPYACGTVSWRCVVGETP